MAKKRIFKVAYKLTNMLNSVIKLGKDKSEKMEQCHAIYKISCFDCDASYVGQTKRKVKTKLKEHIIRRILRNPKDSRTIVSEHQLKYGYKLNWDNILVLDSEPCFHKRLVSEMIFIKK